MYFLTSRLSEKDVADLWKLIPRKDLVDAWRDIETHAKELAKRLTGKEAATPSRTWNLLSTARPEMILFLAVTAKQQAVEQKIKNFLTKWRQVQQRIPLPEMTELLITPQLPEYPKIARDVFMLLLDGKLRSRTETLKFLKPFAPPPPPPPPPPRRGRAAKAVAGAPAPVAPANKGEVAGKGKGKAAAGAPPTAAQVPAPAKPDGKSKSKLDAKSAAPQKSAAQPKSESARSAAKAPSKPASKPGSKPSAKPAAKPPAKKAKTKKR
jgi:tRNA nucleotidyltransferase (CCA-adding enzyme)